MKKPKSPNNIKIGEIYSIESIINIEKTNPNIDIKWFQVGSKGCKVIKINVINPIN